MNRIEQEFKTRFSKRTLTTDQNSHEQMWENITANLSDARKGESKNWSYVVVISLLLIGVIGSLRIAWPYTDHQPVAEVSLSSPISTSNAFSALDDKSENYDIPCDYATKSTHVILNSAQLEETNEQRVTPKKSDFTTDDLSARRTVPINTQSVSVVEQPPTVESSVPDGLEEPEKYVPLATLPTYPGVLTDEPSIFAAYDDNYKRRRRRRSATNFLILTGGPGFSDLDFSSDGDPVWSSNADNRHENQTGYSLKLSAARVWREKWYLQAGLNYQQAWSKFSFSETTSNTDLLQNVLLSMTIDTITGDTVQQTFGDAVVGITTTRRIVHYNRYRTLAIPLTFGRQLQYGAWQVGISLGPVINLTVAQEGRTLGLQEEVIDISEDRRVVPSVDIGWQVSPFVAYQFKDRLRFILESDFSARNTAFLESENHRTNWRQLNAQLGFSYQLEGKK